MADQIHQMPHTERQMRIFCTLLSLIFAFLIQVKSSSAAELRVLASTGLNAVIGELISKFEAQSGHKISLGAPALAADVSKRIEAGEAVDFAVVNPEFATNLIKAGKVASGSQVDFVRLGIGVAMKAGGTKPDISTASALKDAVTAAKSVIYTRGGSGVHFESVLSRLGILDQVKAKSKQVGGGEAMPAVARGEVELGVDVIPQIVSATGVQLVGPLPTELQSYVVLTGVITSSAKEPAAAKAFLDFLKSAVAASIFNAKGMEQVR